MAAIPAFPGEECGGLFAVHGSVLPCWDDKDVEDGRPGGSSDAEPRYTFQIMGLLLDVFTLDKFGHPWS